MWATFAGTGPSIMSASAAPCRIAFVLFLAAGLVLLARILPVPSGYDELQHLSYVAAVQERPTLRPPFAAMRVLDVDDLRAWTAAANWHSHPAVFYLLATPLLDRALPVAEALLPLRLVAFALVAIGVAVVLAAGMRLFAQDPAARLGFCLLVALAPQFVLAAAHFNNDAMGVLGGALAYGALALRAGRGRDALLAAGIVLAFWAKLNAGLLVGAWAFGVALLLRDPRLAAVSVAACAVGALPHLDTLWLHGALVPVTYDSVHRADAVPGPLAERVAVFAARFALSWGFAMTGHPVNAVAFVALLGCILWGAWVALRRGARAPREAVALAGVGAFLLLLAVQAAYAIGPLAGSTAAAQFRYHFPLWPMLAHAAVLPATQPATPAGRRIVMALLAASLIGAMVVAPP